MSDDRERLAQDVLAMIEAGVDGDSAAFDALAIEVFSYQYAHNAPYRAFCDAAGKTPSSVESWRDVRRIRRRRSSATS